MAQASIVHDPGNLVNNLVMQSESMAEAVEQKLVAIEQLEQFTQQLQMFKDRKEHFEKLAKIIAASVEFIEVIEYGENAFKKVTELRENVTSMDDIPYENKYMCVTTLVDCGYVITKMIKKISTHKENLKESKGEDAENEIANDEYLYRCRQRIKEQVLRAQCCVNDVVFKSQLERANYDACSAAFCMKSSKNVYKNGKLYPASTRKVTVNLPGGEKISIDKPYYK